MLSSIILWLQKLPADSYKYLSALFVSPLWYAFLSHFSDFAYSIPVTTIIILWAVDFLFGVSCAVKTKTFDKSQLRKCFPKLIWYLVFIGLGYLMRINHLTLAACPLEALPILIELISVMTNAADLSEIIILKKLSKIFEYTLDDQIEMRLNDLEMKRQKRVVVTNGDIY